jgi:hypothetical protein
VSDEALKQHETVTWNDVNTHVMGWMTIKVVRVNWFPYTTFIISSRCESDGRIWILRLSKTAVAKNPMILRYLKRNRNAGVIQW